MERRQGEVELAGRAHDDGERLLRSSGRGAQLREAVAGVGKHALRGPHAVGLLAQGPRSDDDRVGHRAQEREHETVARLAATHVARAVLARSAERHHAIDGRNEVREHVRRRCRKAQPATVPPRDVGRQRQRRAVAAIEQRLQHG